MRIETERLQSDARLTGIVPEERRAARDLGQTVRAGLLAPHPRLLPMTIPHAKVVANALRRMPRSDANAEPLTSSRIAALFIPAAIVANPAE